MKSIMFAEHVLFPETVNDLVSFRQWVTSDEFPEEAHVSYLNGEIWVDLPMERASHNQCKTAVSATLSVLVKSEKMGLYFSDGMLLSNLKADLSTQPDGTFISIASADAGLVTVLRGNNSIEITGSPDMTLEVISPTSVKKDKVQLPELYWLAGVREYWLVDSRENRLSFDIFRRGKSKFVAIRKNQGWIKSQVFGREFKLTESLTALNISEFTLEMR